MTHASHTPCLRRCSIAIFAVLLCCRATVEVLAGTGGVIVTPNPAEPASHGIRLTIDPYWVEGYGYRPVRVKADAVTGADFDRTVSVRIMVDDDRWQSNQIDVTVAQDFVLPAGAPSAETTIAVPQYREWNQMGWKVFVDGSFAKELSFEFVTGPSQAAGGGNVHQPRVLYVDSAPVRTATPVPPLNQQDPRTPVPVPVRPTFPPGALATPTANMANAVTVPRRDLPTRWFDYSCLDIVQLSSAELDKVVQQRKDAWKAIRQWVAAGGNLVVYGVASGSAWSDETKRVDGHLKEPPGSRAGRTAVAWRGEPEEPPRTASTPQAEDWTWERAVDVVEDSGFRPLAQDFRWRPYKFGTVVISKDAAAVAYESSGQREPPAQHRQYWTLRHGVSPQWGTVDFLNLLIPGVGLAPVGMFRILITLFVIVIGPVNYFMLRRRRRLYLFLLTAPMCAVAVTAALIAYALFTDGFGTRVRVRSFTEIDQRRGEAASWSRQSYYAGIAPRGGMKMTGDAMVVPLEPSSSFGGNSRNDLHVREIEWSADNQRLARGWLNSRTPTQYLVVRSGDSDKKLAVSNRDGQIAVRNQLGTRIVALLVVDGAGECYWGEDIAADTARRQLSPTEGPAAGDKLAVLFGENEPRFPQNMGEGSELLGTSRRYYGYSLNQREAPTLANSRLEQSLRKYGPEYPLKPEPGTYLAIVDRSPGVAVGVEGAIEESSFHVIFGRY